MNLNRNGGMGIARALTIAWLLAATCANAKPVMQGLVSMGEIRFHQRDGGVPNNSLAGIEARPGLLGGVVINIAWSQIEPFPGAFDPAAIERALESVRAYNTAHPDAPLAVDLRVWPGPNAPSWAKNLGGKPVRILRLLKRQSRQEVTVGRFWDAPYRAAWKRLQDRLAARYDADPLIREVSNTSCSSLTDEPLLLSADPESLANLHAAGFSDAAFERCLLESARDYDGWAETNVHYALNPFRRTDSGRPVLANEVTLDVARAFRAALGARGVLSNHALQSSPPAWVAAVMKHIRTLGPPIELQTQSPKAGDGLDWEAAMAYAKTLGAGAVEVWTGESRAGFETKAAEELSRWTATLPRGPGRP